MSRCTLGVAICSAQLPSLSPLKLGLSLAKKEEERTLLTASTLLPKPPFTFQISGLLGALGPDTSEQGCMPLGSTYISSGKGLGYS